MQPKQLHTPNFLLIIKRELAHTWKKWIHGGQRSVQQFFFPSFSLSHYVPSFIHTVVFGVIFVHTENYTGRATSHSNQKCFSPPCWIWTCVSRTLHDSSIRRTHTHSRTRTQTIILTTKTLFWQKRCFETVAKPFDTGETLKWAHLRSRLF